MEIGIIGLPNVGKSTLFNAITSLKVPAENFPFTTIEPNVGIVPMKDSRLEKLGEIFKPEKLTPTTVKFVDIAGLVKGASEGQGLGNKFLSHIRNVDAIIQVVRVFSTKDVVNTLGNTNPKEEIGIIDTELVLSDIEQIKREKEKLEGQVKAGRKDAKDKFELICRITEFLDENIPLRNAIMDNRIESGSITEFNFLSAKPILYLFNIDDKETKLLEETREFVKSEKKSDSIAVNAQFEFELSQFEGEEKAEFEKEMKYNSRLGELIKKAHEILGLITFYTVVGKEIRVWSIRKGTNIKSASGKIHTDMEKGFIRAEVYGFAELIRNGSEKILREKGIVRTEGKDYIVKDGDIVRILFQPS